MDFTKDKFVELQKKSSILGEITWGGMKLQLIFFAFGSFSYLISKTIIIIKIQ